MKKVFIFSALVLATFSFISCSKQTGDCSRIAAKILRYDCDRVIFQLLSAENIGDVSWTDVQTGSTYSNVVSYYNTCAVNSVTNGRLDTLYVSVTSASGTTVGTGCNQCQAISDNPPHTKVGFEAIAVSPCEITNSPNS